MRLSGLRSLAKSGMFCFLFVVSGKGEPQCRKLHVSFEPAKAFLGFVHGRSGPAQSHRGRTPALHIASCAQPITPRSAARPPTSTPRPPPAPEHRPREAAPLGGISALRR